MFMKRLPLLFLFSGLALAPLGSRANPKADFDEPPMPVKSVAPAYPAALREAQVTGIVTLTVTISETGEVVERTVAKSTRAEFEAPALDAMGKWKFRPARKAGENVQSKVNIPIKFAVGD